jgi:hypothetical protein
MFALKTKKQPAGVATHVTGKANRGPQLVAARPPSLVANHLEDGADRIADGLLSDANEKPAAPVATRRRLDHGESSAALDQFPGTVADALRSNGQRRSQILIHDLHGTERRAPDGR